MAARKISATPPAWEWLSTGEAMRHIGVSKTTLYKLVEDGTVPAYRMGRVLRFRSERGLDSSIAADEGADPPARPAAPLPHRRLLRPPPSKPARAVGRRLGLRRSDRGDERCLPGRLWRLAVPPRGSARVGVGDLSAGLGSRPWPLRGRCGACIAATGPIPSAPKAVHRSYGGREWASRDHSGLRGGPVLEGTWRRPCCSGSRRGPWVYPNRAASLSPGAGGGERGGVVVQGDGEGDDPGEGEDQPQPSLFFGGGCPHAGLAPGGGEDAGGADPGPAFEGAA